MKKSPLTKKVLAIFAAATPLLAGAPAQAGIGTSLMQTGTVKDPGQFEVKAQADLVFQSHVNDGGSGFNVSPHVETGLVQHYWDIDAFFGTGTTDFQLGAITKFNLLPDIESQLALAFLGGLSFAKESVDGISRSGYIATLGIITSKRLESDFGVVTPYVAYEFEPFFQSFETIFASDLLLGAKWEPTRTQPWAFYSEITVGLHRGVYGIALGASQTF